MQPNRRIGIPGSSTPITTLTLANQPPSPSQNPEDWHVVLRSYQGVVVRYNRDQRALAVETRQVPGPLQLGRSPSGGSKAAFPRTSSSYAADQACPLCKRPFSTSSGAGSTDGGRRGFSTTTYNASSAPKLTDRNAPEHLSTDYFHLLAQAHESSPSFATPEPSRPGTPVSTDVNSKLDESSFSEGYYQRFFTEISQLGRGMSGSVFLCQHVLNGNPLGMYACKKIAVGNNARSLVKALKEITHLESLRHPNIVAIHHVWLETAALSLGPAVPCLFALMDYANDGSLDGYIRARGGLQDAGATELTSTEELKARARQRKARHTSPGTEARPVHYLNQDEILQLFTDVSNGLAFLHQHNMLHLDIKAENILLHRHEGSDGLVPTAMLTDFGSSEARNAINRNQKSGVTGTLDYLAPESFIVAEDGRPRQHAAGLDMWALGLVLHLLMFFRLPYQASDDVDALTDEIKAYTGFNRHTTNHARPDLHVIFLELLEDLININPFERISAATVKLRVQGIRSTAEQATTKATTARNLAKALKKTFVQPTSLHRPSSRILSLPSPKTEDSLDERIGEVVNKELTVTSTQERKARELSTLALLAVRAGLLWYCRSLQWEHDKSPSLPLSCLALLLSISALELASEVGTGALSLTSLGLVLLAIFSPKTVFLS